MQLHIEKDLQSVLEFMQENIPVAKLVRIAERLPEAARLLWSQFPQEPYRPAILHEPKPNLDQQCQQLPDATK